MTPVREEGGISMGGNKKQHTGLCGVDSNPDNGQQSTIKSADTREQGRKPRGLGELRRGNETWQVYYL